MLSIKKQKKNVFKIVFLSHFIFKDKFLKVFLRHFNFVKNYFFFLAEKTIFSVILISQISDLNQGTIKIHATKISWLKLHFWITISNLSVCLPTLELTTFEQ